MTTAPRRNGFTLLELIVVVAVAAVLIALLLPALSGLKAAGRTAYCASNLNQLRLALTANPQKDPYSMLPPPEQWVEHIFGRGVGDAAICPADGREDLGAGIFDNVVIRQRANTGEKIETTIDDLLLGRSPDDQVSFYYGGNYLVAPFVERGYGNLNVDSWSAWVVDRLNAEFGPGIASPEDVPDHVGWVTIDASAMVTFEFGGEVTIKSHRRADFMTWGGSDHWVIHEGDVQLQLGGKHSDGDTGSFTVAGGVLSYGMNSQIRDDQSLDTQVLLLDYHKLVADRDAADGAVDDFAAFFAGRHHGRANVLRVDGSITKMTPEQAAGARWAAR